MVKSWRRKFEPDLGKESIQTICEALRDLKREVRDATELDNAFPGLTQAETRLMYGIGGKLTGNCTAHYRRKKG